MSDDLRAVLDELTPEERGELQRLAREECWRSGDLTYKFHAGQREIWESMQARQSRRWVLEIGRKWGKTYFLVVVAALIALSRPKSRVVYGAPTLNHLKEFVLPVLEEVAEDAPPDCRPEYEPSTGHWKFQNGSWVHFFGADDKRKANRGRGPKAELAVFDEAGFSPVLQYVIKSIFRPSLMLSPGSWTLLGSTPAEEPDHDFTRICETAEVKGTLFHATFHDNPFMSDADREEEIRGAAEDDGLTVEAYKASSEFRREYLAERVTNKTLIVMGDDWERARPTALVESPRPQFFDAYESLDMGGTDPRAWLAGFWDFANARLVIEDELNLRDNENTLQLAEAIKAKEAALYGSKAWDGTLRAIREEKADDNLLAFLPPEERAKVRRAESAPLQPYLRVCDHDIQTAIDLSVLHGLTFVPAEKTTLAMVVNEFRVALRMDRVRIHPRCRDLDRQLRTTLWQNERAIDFKRKNGEHGDLLWCAIYLWRNIRKSKNPVPANFGVDPERQHVRPPPANPLRSIVGMRRR